MYQNHRLETKKNNTKTLKTYHLKKIKLWQIENSNLLKLHSKEVLELEKLLPPKKALILRERNKKNKT